MKLNKVILNYSILAIAMFLFDKLYASFGHGVTSHWMSNMYLYLLGFGVLVFILFRVLAPNIVALRGYRVFFNIYNSGVALLINGMLLNGILEIAGGTSQTAPLFIYAGSGLILAAAVSLFIIIGGRAPGWAPKDRRNTAIN